MIIYDIGGIRLHNAPFESNKYPDRCFDFALSDPLYDNAPHINAAVAESIRLSKGASALFMFAEDLCDLKVKPDQVLFWVKPISTKNTARRYSRFVEVVAIFNIEKGYFNSDAFWASKSGVFTDSLASKPIHPFEKPRSLIEKLIGNHTRPGESVIDLCAGSGTTLAVAKEMGRSAVGFEQAPQYCDIAVRRLSK